MDHIQQAKELKSRISNALRELQRRGAPRENSGSLPFKENEVLFRYKTIEGLLRIALNDVMRMVHTWEEEDRHDSDDLDDLNEWALRE